VVSRPAAARRGRLRELTAEGWFRLALLVLGVLVVAAALVVLAVLNQNRTAVSNLAGSIEPAQAQAYRLQGALVDQETGVRGYAITGDSRFLAPYTSGRAIETSAVARLRALIGGTQPMAADLSRLERAANGWRHAYALPLINLASHGPLNGHDLAQVTASKQSFDHLRVLFAAQNHHLAEASAAASASVAADRTQQDWVYAAILAVFLLVAAGLAVALQRAVVRPLRRLTAAARLVADGDYSHRIEPGGPADLWSLAVSMEGMRSGLVSALDDSRTAAEVTAQQAADLDAQAGELRRSNAELEQFAYVASHDLQEPLRKVASFCQLLEKRYGDQLDERGLQYIAFAVDGAKRMQVLINDLLTFSRVGRSGELVERLPLDQPLDTALNSLSVAIEDADAVVERPERLPEVVGDPTLLAMLWQNLIGNALKFRAPGRPPVVQITAAAQPAGGWQFAVTDNGIGIPPEFAEKVFVIFQRLHGRGVYPGTGIGLALCKRIVEQHGGEMHLDTSYADGTRIIFTLPAANPAPAPDSGTSTASEAPEGITA
jgi:signal transduction histidine kinase